MPAEPDPFGETPVPVEGWYVMGPEPVGRMP